MGNVNYASAISGIFGIALIVTSSLILVKFREPRNSCHEDNIDVPAINSYCTTANVFVGASAVGIAAGCILFFTGIIAILKITDRKKNALLMAGHMVSFLFSVCAFTLAVNHHNDDLVEFFRKRDGGMSAKFLLFYITAGLHAASCIACVAKLVYNTKESAIP